MSAPNNITVAGNLTADPEHTTTSSELSRTKLRLAVSRRIFVPETSTWEDRQDGYFTVVCWREMARTVHRSLRKGDRVVVSGRLSRRQYEVADADGSGTETRHVYEIDADEVGASLRWDIWTRQPRPARGEGAAPHPAMTTVDTSAGGPGGTTPGDDAEDTTAADGDGPSPLGPGGVAAAA